MILVIVFNLLFCTSLLQVCTADDDRFWILLDHINVYECQGVANQMTVKKEDVSIVDKNGKLALYLECPNEYTVVVNNIKAKETLPNLSGDMAATLQVPLIQGPGGISLDYPYQVIPQKKPLEGSQCDNESGVIIDNKKEYCRYCELCETVGHSEKQVGPEAKLGHQYIQVDQQDSFGKKCRQLDDKTFAIKKNVNVPGKKEIQDSINKNVKGKLEEQLEKKLKIGKGKFSVNLQMFSGKTPPTPSNQWYPNHKGCECCVKDASGNSNCQRSFMNKMAGSFAGGVFAGSGNNCLKCNNDYVKSCFPSGTPPKVSCYTIEFNFRVTDKESDVEQFKAESDYNSKSQATNYGPVETKKGEPETKGVIATGGNAEHGAVVLGTDKPKSAGGQPGGGQPPQCSACSKDECLNKIAFPSAKTYCTRWWDTPNAKKFCCSKCPTVCSPL